MKIRAWFLSICLLAAMGRGILAQNYVTFRDEIDRLRQSGGYSFGPLRIFPLFKLRDFGYDNNVYYDDSQRAPVKDFTGTLSPEIRVVLPFRSSLILSMSENPEYVYFIKEKNQRGFTNSYSLGMKYLLFSRFVLSGEFRQGEQRRRVSMELPIPALDRVRSYEARLFYETPRKTSLGFTWSVQKLEYEDIQMIDRSIPLSRVLDREERSASMEFYYQLFGRSVFFAKAGALEYRFLNELSTWRNASAAYVLSGLQFPLMGRIRGSLSLGYKNFNPKIPGQKSFSGIFGDTGLDMRTGRFGLRVSYSRDVVFSYFADVSYFVNNGYIIGGSFYLTSFLRMDYNYSLGKSDYPEPTLTVTPEGETAAIMRSDRQQTHSLGFAVRFYRNTGIGVSYNMSRWTSNIPGFNRTRGFIGLFLTQQF
jgi:hypothetical protein